MELKIEDFKHENRPKKTTVIRAARIPTEYQKFLVDNNINFQKLINTIIAELMKTSSCNPVLPVKQKKVEIEHWLNQQINIMIESLKAQSHYDKKYTEGALSFAKKVQAKMREFR